MVGERAGMVERIESRFKPIDSEDSKDNARSVEHREVAVKKKATCPPYWSRSPQVAPLSQSEPLTNDRGIFAFICPTGYALDPLIRL